MRIEYVQTKAEPGLSVEREGAIRCYNLAHVDDLIYIYKFFDVIVNYGIWLKIDQGLFVEREGFMQWKVLDYVDEPAISDTSLCHNTVSRMDKLKTSGDNVYWSCEQSYVMT